MSGLPPSDQHRSLCSRFFGLQNARNCSPTPRTCSRRLSSAGNKPRKRTSIPARLYVTIVTAGCASTIFSLRCVRVEETVGQWLCRNDRYDPSKRSPAHHCVEASPFHGIPRGWNVSRRWNERFLLREGIRVMKYRDRRDPRAQSEVNWRTRFCGAPVNT